MGIFIFWPRRANIWRGYNLKTDLPVSILGHIQACPTRFLAHKTSVMLKKRWAQKKLFVRRLATICMYVHSTYTYMYLYKNQRGANHEKKNAGKVANKKQGLD